MAEVTRKTIRLEVVGGNEAVASVRQVGEQGDAAFNRLGQAAQRAGGQLQQAGQQVRSAGETMRGALGNVSQQLQDVVVQAQMGTDAFQILAQQGPQIAGAFGPAGAAIGLLVGIAAAAGGALLGMGKDASTAADDLEKLIGSLADAAGGADDLIKKLKEMGPAAQVAVAAQARTAAAEAADTIEGLATEVGTATMAARRRQQRTMGVTGQGSAVGRAAAAATADVTAAIRAGDTEAALEAMARAGILDNADLRDRVVAAANTIKTARDVEIEAQGGIRFPGSGNRVPLPTRRDEAVLDELIEREVTERERKAEQAAREAQTKREQDARKRETERRRALVAAERDAEATAQIRAQLMAVDDPEQQAVERAMASFRKEATAAERAEREALVRTLYRETQARKDDEKSADEARRAQEQDARWLEGMAPKVERLEDAYQRLQSLRGRAGFDPAQIDRAEAELARRQQQAQRAELERARDVGSGIELALTDYADKAGDLAEQAERAVVNSLGGIEDAFAELARTGTVNFSKLADSVVNDLTRMAVRAAILGPLIEAFGGYFQPARPTGAGSGTNASNVSRTPGGGGQHHDGGIVGNSAITRLLDPRLWQGAPRFHNGGLVGDEVPIIARRGERILTPEQAAASGRVNVVVNNNTGTPMQAEQRRTASGDVEVTLTNMMRQQIGRGAFDDVLHSRLGTSTAARR